MCQLHPTTTSTLFNTTQHSLGPRQLAFNHLYNESYQQHNKVNTLMKVIQVKIQSTTPQKDASGKKPHKCAIGNCTKGFSQKVHLHVHERAHTGVKPYVSSMPICTSQSCPKFCSQLCKEPDCSRSFSQNANLRVRALQKSASTTNILTQKELQVHQRRHTGERPY